MKTLITAIVFIVISIFLILFFRFNEIKSYTKYDSKYDAIKKAYVSSKGDVILVTDNSYLELKPAKQFSLFTNEFLPSVIDDVPTPKWTDFIPGEPTKEKVADFHEVKIVKGS